MRRTPALLAALVLAAGLAGCGGKADTGTALAASPSALASFPVTVGKLTLDRAPRHIVSLSPTGTEMLYAVGAGRQVTAVDDQSTYPSDAPRAALSGFKPNAEAIAAKDPDLVVISNDIDKISAQLAKLKIPVYLAPAATTLDDSYRELTEIGALTGHPAEAAALVGRTRDEIAKLVKDTPRPATSRSYYYELDPTLYTVTSKTFIGSLFSLFGARNVADPADAKGAAGGYPQLSVEALVKANPDMIFLADTKCCKQNLDTVRKRPGLAAVTAVKDGHVYPLDDDIASRWGPRVVDLVRAIADAMHQVAG